jgi:hypothetical protein
VAVPPVDATYSGSSFGMRLEQNTPGRVLTYRGVVSLGQVSPLGAASFASTSRVMAALSVQSAQVIDLSPSWQLRPTLRATEAIGRSFDATWQRLLVDGSVGLVSSRNPEMGLRVAASLGGTTGGAPPYERFLVGGNASPYVEDVLMTQRIASPALPVGAASGSRYGRLRVEGAGTLRPFIEWVGAGDALGGWQRVIGAEFEESVGPLPSIRIPQVSVRLGVANRANAPWPHATQLYASIALRP